MIFGRPGSGKSTFAFELAEQLKIPLFHLDRYFYSHQWIERDYDEFLAIQKDLVTQDNWIVDGNATKSLEMRYARADIVIYFCLPRIICFWRVLKRRLFFKDCRIDDRAPECYETIRWGLIKYMWTFEARVNDKIAYLQVKYPHAKFYIVHNTAERNKLMDKLIKSK